MHPASHARPAARSFRGARTAIAGDAGRKLRIDSTVVQTTIHYPTDSGLLLDSVRTLGRLIRRARPAVAPRLAGVRDAFRTRTRSTRRQVQQVHRATRRKGAAAVAAQQAAYARLCQVARQVE